jgi:hypothetical protein
MGAGASTYATPETSIQTVDDSMRSEDSMHSFMTDEVARDQAAAVYMEQVLRAELSNLHDASEVVILRAVKSFIATITQSLRRESAQVQLKLQLHLPEGCRTLPAIQPLKQVLQTVRQILVNNDTPVSHDLLEHTNFYIVYDSAI